MCSDIKETVKIQLLEKEYLINCPSAACETLKAAGLKLNQNMREIKNNGKVVGVERTVVMASLNVIHQLLTQNQLLNAQLEALKKEISASEQHLTIRLPKSLLVSQYG